VKPEEIAVALRGTVLHYGADRAAVRVVDVGVDDSGNHLSFKLHDASAGHNIRWAITTGELLDLTGGVQSAERIKSAAAELCATGQGEWTAYSGPSPGPGQTELDL
jgi:hypothetical protein